MESQQSDGADAQAAADLANEVSDVFSTLAKETPPGLVFIALSMVLGRTIARLDRSAQGAAVALVTKIIRTESGSPTLQ